LEKEEIEIIDLMPDKKKSKKVVPTEFDSLNSAREDS